MTAQFIVDRALATIGVPFRLHGREPATGLDCIGVAAWALRLTDVPSGYRYGSGIARWTDWLDSHGFVIVDPPRPGDLCLVACAPRRLHLMVRVVGGHVHAHAGLGRVVRMPGPSPWPIIASYRAPLAHGSS